MGDESVDTDPPFWVIKAVGLTVVLHIKKVIGRYQKRVELLPPQQVAGNLRNRVRRRLIEPWNHLPTGVREGLRGVRLVVPRHSLLLATVAREGMGRACHAHYRKPRQGCATALQQSAS